MILPFQNPICSTEFQINFHAFLKTLSEATFLRLQAATGRENVAVLVIFDSFWAAIEFSATPKTTPEPLIFPKRVFFPGESAVSPTHREYPRVFPGGTSYNTRPFWRAKCE